jgi:hypothetical protein
MSHDIEPGQAVHSLLAVAISKRESEMRGGTSEAPQNLQDDESDDGIDDSRTYKEVELGTVAGTGTTSHSAGQNRGEDEADSR